MKFNALNGGNKMKINFKNEKPEDIYKVGNVIKKDGDYLYLITEDAISKYSIVNLTKNAVIVTSNSLEELIAAFADDGDVLVNAEINVF